MTKAHKPPISGSIAETGGRVIGGHRAGEGQNFEGMIDEVAIWNRVLAVSEIDVIYNNGTPLCIPRTFDQERDPAFRRPHSAINVMRDIETAVSIGILNFFSNSDSNTCLF